MFEIAIFIAVYGYLVFSLGRLSFLNQLSLLSVSVSTVVFVLLYFRIFNKAQINHIPQILKKNKKSLFFKFCLLLIVVQALINLIGALGPELSFDALWYHLTLPKLYLQNNFIGYIPGDVFYYSSLPKLINLVYLLPIAFNIHFLPSLIHFLFGILSVFVTYAIVREYTTDRVAMLSSVIFYSSLVVGWQSTTAYIDLARTFFEALALLALIKWQKSNEKKWYLESAVMSGIAISTKLIAISTLPLLLLIIFLQKRDVKQLIPYVLTAILIPMPFFIASYLDTGNLVYPLFHSYPYSFDPSIFNPVNFVKDLASILLFSPDPITPIYAMVLPLLFTTRLKRSEKTLLIYVIGSAIIWYFTPRTGGGRFLLPYLPAFSALTAILIFRQKKNLKNILILLVFTVSLISILYRGVANAKYIPYLTEYESKSSFLETNLNYDFGDFYDERLNHLVSKENKALIIGIHNLYYLDFPFVHISSIQKGEEFDTIIVRKPEQLPERFKHWNKIYETNYIEVYRSKNKWHY